MDAQARLDEPNLPRARNAFPVHDANRKHHQPILLPALSRHLAFRRDESDVDEARWLSCIESLILEVFTQLQIAVGDRAQGPSISNLKTTPPSQFDKQTLPDAGDFYVAKKVHLLRKIYNIEIRSNKKPSFLEEKPDDNSTFRPSRYETVVLYGVFKQLPMTIRFEVFEEYFTVTVVLEFRVDPKDRNAACPGQTNSNTEKCSLRGYMRSLIDKLNCEAPEKLAEKRNLVATEFNELGPRLWESFDTELLNLALNNSKQPKTGKKDPNPGDWVPARFADFRGFFFCQDNEKIAQVDFAGNGAQSQFVTRFPQFGKFHSDDNNRSYVAKLFPLLLAIELQGETPTATTGGNNQPRKFELVEYSWSIFERKSVLHGTALGPHLYHKKDTPEYGSSYHVLFFSHSDAWSVARTVGRLQMMGTVRLAALLDFDRIERRDEILSGLDSDLSSIESADDGEAFDDKALEQLIVRTAQRLARKVVDFEEVAIHFEDVLKNHNVSVPDETRDILCNFYKGKHREAINKFKETVDSEHDKNEKKADRKRRKDGDYDLRKFVSQASKQQDLECFRTDVETLREHCEKALNPKGRPAAIMGEIRSAWRYLREASRSLRDDYQVAASIRSIPSCRRTILDKVGMSLSRMNDPIRFRQEYRTARSLYHRDLFDELAKAMDVRPIPGFQQYDEIVRHRLQRSYQLIAAVGVKLRAISQRKDELENKFGRDNGRENIVRLHRIQAFGELILLFVLAPYYLFMIPMLGISRFLCSQFPDLRKLIEGKIVEYLDFPAVKVQGYFPDVLAYCLALSFAFGFWLLFRQESRRQKMMSILRHGRKILTTERTIF